MTKESIIDSGTRKFELGLQGVEPVRGTGRRRKEKGIIV
jgi:hypothetical protein